MQLQNIDTKKLDYSPNKPKSGGNPRQKQANHLSMYGSTTILRKSTITASQSSLYRRKPTKSDKDAKTQTVSADFDSDGFLCTTKMFTDCLHTFWRTYILLQP